MKFYGKEVDLLIAFFFTLLVPPLASGESTKSDADGGYFSIAIPGTISKCVLYPDPQGLESGRRYGAQRCAVERSGSG